MKKAGKLCLKCLAGVLAAFGLLSLVLVLWNVARMPEIQRISETAFDLPGHEDPLFDRQGIAWDEETNTFLFSGYRIDGAPCPLYLRRADGTVTRIELLGPDGSPLRTHAGGIALCGDYVYVAGSGADCLHVFRREEVLSAWDGEGVRSLGRFATAVSEEDGVRASFLTSDGETVYVGEFHLPGLPMFRLRSNHAVGSTRALLAAFPADPDKPLGLSDAPSAAYCLPDMVQGVAFGEDRVYLSRAFFLFPSELTACAPAPAGTLALMGAEVPLYTLEETAGVGMPPFGEGIELVDGKLYLATESPLLPARFYGLWEGQKCRTVPVENIR